MGIIDLVIVPRKTYWLEKENVLSRTGLWNIFISSKNVEPSRSVGQLAFWGLTALWDSISVYIRPSPKERE